MTAAIRPAGTPDASAARRRVCIFGERLRAPLDEGIKKLTLSLAASYRGLGHDVLTLTTDAPDWPEQEVIAAPADRLLRSPVLAAKLAAFRPSVVVYVPTASLTLASGLRAGVLRRYAGAPVALFATQGRRHGRLVQLAARGFSPDICAAQAHITVEQANRLGWRTVKAPPAVDLSTYRPVEPGRKRSLRRKFGLPEEGFVVLHAGHLNRSRGVESLLAITDLAVPVLVASTSTPQDEALADQLRAGGVTVLTRFIPQISDLYGCVDAYLFPTPPDREAPSSIDAPLSVLEAAACNLPIISTRFGALPELWPSAPGIHYYHDVATLRAALTYLRDPRVGPCATRALVEPFCWEKVAELLLVQLLKPEAGQ